MYELCTLRRPFEGDSWNLVINNIIYSDYAPLPKEQPKLFSTVLDMTLQKNAGIRASIEEVLSLKEVRERLEYLKVKYPEMYPGEF